MQQQQGARSLNSAVLVLASFGTDEKILAVIEYFDFRRAFASLGDRQRRSYFLATDEYSYPGTKFSTVPVRFFFIILKRRKIV